jgi:hypothetical protein
MERIIITDEKAKLCLCKRNGCATYPGQGEPFCINGVGEPKLSRAKSPCDCGTCLLPIEAGFDGAHFCHGCEPFDRENISTEVSLELAPLSGGINLSNL